MKVWDNELQKSGLLGSDGSGQIVGVDFGNRDRSGGGGCCCFGMNGFTYGVLMVERWVFTGMSSLKRFYIGVCLLRTIKVGKSTYEGLCFGRYVGSGNVIHL